MRILFLNLKLEKGLAKKTQDCEENPFCSVEKKDFKVSFSIPRFEIGMT